MKSNMLPTIAIVLCLSSLLMAQPTAQVYRVELAIPFGTVPGKVVTTGDHLVFIDEQQPEASLVVSRGAIENVISQQNVVTLEFRQSVRVRSGDRTKLDFRVTEGDPAKLKSWFGPSSGAAGSTKPAIVSRQVTKAEEASAGKAGASVVPADTVVRMRLNQGISSRTAQKGDTFTASVVAPVVIENKVVIPEGSTVHGRVTEVTRAERRSNGTIAVAFHQIELPSQERVEIHGSLTSLQDEKGQNQSVGQEGEVEGKSTAKRNVVFIGGGAGVGALIGAVAGGGKGAGIGAALGAGLGTLGTLLSEGNEVEVASGTEIAMILDRELALATHR